MVDRSKVDVRAGLDAWYKQAESHNPAGLDAILDDDVVFLSPVVHTPQEGKMITTDYLASAGDVLGSADFEYTGEYLSDTGAVLEFKTKIEGIQINGIDMITWNSAGKIIEFKVMLRPLKAVNMVHAKMGEMLEKLKAQA
ncbi:nuclear transport factor 2 family protein [Kordiimonas sp. SCSIO 12610]|uniref:nuclear transport factor 2 family protein n=1 Tax=Kordiimonas sp. SCSIO 12610 TaxID=2829597 RepID=UPI00210B184C|nr:nuclear transport factor 2 family protein [Kordiimonas sp. SCSIO 12610]UTW56343.1 nuclear transport factor 2 family protein [Kordiimonas sp. SCSIO 12610]